MKKLELKQIIKEEISKALNEGKNSEIEGAIEALLNDSSLIDPKVNKYNFSIRYFPKTYKGDEQLTISVEQNGDEYLYDLSIDNFIKYLQQKKLVKNPTRLKQELENILSN